MTTVQGLAMTGMQIRRIRQSRACWHGSTCSTGVSRPCLCSECFCDFYPSELQPELLIQKPEPHTCMHAGRGQHAALSMVKHVQEVLLQLLPLRTAA